MWQDHLTPLAWKKRSKQFVMRIYIESTVKLLLILRDLCIVFQLLRNQFKEYFEVNFYNPDFKYHQRELDEQILCNKRIRQNVREAREMYADKSNPWYSRKTFRPKEVSSVCLS